MTSMKMEFQYVSDIHMEMGAPVRPIARRAPYLILAGDLGDPSDAKYAELLRAVSEEFDTVFVLTGNHEYYTRRVVLSGRAHLYAVDAQVREICARFPNVVFLQNSAHDVPGTDVTVIGSTLWSHVVAHEARDVTKTIADYRLIPGFDVALCNQLHAEATGALEALIAARRGRRIVVVTHHMPRTSLIDARYRSCGLNSAFASDVACASDDGVAAWVYGHTHTPRVEGRFMCNPVGYPGENAIVDNMERTFTLAMLT